MGIYVTKYIALCVYPCFKSNQHISSRFLCESAPTLLIVVRPVDCSLRRLIPSYFNSKLSLLLFSLESLGFLSLHLFLLRLHSTSQARDQAALTIVTCKCSIFTFGNLPSGASANHWRILSNKFLATSPHRAICTMHCASHNRKPATSRAAPLCPIPARVSIC